MNIIITYSGLIKYSDVFHFICTHHRSDHFWYDMWWWDDLHDNKLIDYFIFSILFIADMTWDRPFSPCVNKNISDSFTNRYIITISSFRFIPIVFIIIFKCILKRLVTLMGIQAIIITHGGQLQLFRHFTYCSFHDVGLGRVEKYYRFIQGLILDHFQDSFAH